MDLFRNPTHFSFSISCEYLIASIARSAEIGLGKDFFALGDFKDCIVLFFIFSFFTKKLKKDFNDDITRAIDVVPMP